MSRILALITGDSSVGGVTCAVPSAADCGLLLVFLSAGRRGDRAIDPDVVGPVAAHRPTVDDVRLLERHAGPGATHLPPSRENGSPPEQRAWHTFADGSATNTPLITTRTPTEGEWTCPPSIPLKQRPSPASPPRQHPPGVPSSPRPPLSEESPWQAA